MSTPAKPPAKPAAAPAAPKSPLRPVAYLRFLRPTAVPGYDRHQLELTAGADTAPLAGAPSRDNVATPPMFRDAETGDFLVGEDRYPAHMVERYRRARMAAGKPSE
jgi:hypothetical protein